VKRKTQMKRNKKRQNKRNGGYQNKLSLFQKPEMRFKRNCPFSVKDAPIIDYKNIKLLRKYTSENGKILPSRITSVSHKKQRELSRSIKQARILALI